MKYRVEYNKVCADTVKIHLDINLFDFLPRPKSNNSPSSSVIFFEDEFDEMTEEPFFIRRLLMIKGIEDVGYFKYSIDIKKGDLFSWKDIIPQVIGDLRITVNHGRRAQNVCKRNRKIKKVKVP